jgi:ABC-type nitrate/sulfonate/bicarbonate transport system substrate-binding protein
MLNGEKIRPRRRPAVIFVAVAGLAMALASACSASSPSNSAGGGTATVTVAVSSTNMNDLPVWVAQQEGYYAKAGLNVKTAVLTASTTNTALDSGSVQFIDGNPTEFVQALAKGTGQLAVEKETVGIPLGFVISPAFAAKHGITSKTPIQTVAKDLIGSTGGSSAAATTGEAEIFLSEFGVTSSQVKIATLASPAADQAALKSNEIDWFCTSEPIPYEVQAAGSGIVVATPENVPAWSADQTGIGAVIVTAKSYAQANPAVVKEFVTATQEAAKYISLNPARALAIAASQFPGVSQAVLKNSLAEIQWPTDGKMTDALWQTTVGFIIKQGVVPGGSTVASTDWTNQYLS